MPSGYNNNIVSGTKVAYNSYFKVASISTTSGDNYYFHSVWLGSAWNDLLNIELIGYVDGIEKYS